MSIRTAEVAYPTHAATLLSTDVRCARQAYWLLYITFVVAPIIAGLDKFANLLRTGSNT